MSHLRINNVQKMKLEI